MYIENTHTHTSAAVLVRLKSQTSWMAFDKLTRITSGSQTFTSVLWWHGNMSITREGLKFKW